MNTVYIVDDKRYSVGQSKLEQFLNDFPNAVKEAEMGKQTGLTQDPTVSQEDMGSQLDDGSSESVSWFDQTWFGRGFRAASTTGEATDLMAESFSNIDIEKVRDFIAAKEDQAKNYVPSERMQEFQKQYVKEGSTWSAFFRGVKNQPGLLPELFVQSLGTQIGTAFDAPESLAAAGTGAAAGAVVGAVPGAIAGAMGGLATSMEAALTFGELIEEELKLEGKEFTDENVKALLEGPKGRSIRNKSLGRGLAIGTIEGLTGGLAGKVATTTKAAVGVTRGARAATLAAAGAGTTIEGVGGGLGEVAGRVVAGQGMDAAEIGFEAITGTVTAPVNVGYALATAKAPVYKLNGETVTYDQMKDFVDTADDVDIAMADIKMENDFTGIGKKAAAKQEAARTGIALSGDTETIGLVEEAVAEQDYQANMEFAKKHSKLYGLDFTELSQDEIKERFKDTENSDLTNSLGGIVGSEIIINKDLAKTKVYGDNVGNHELLHGIIKASGQQGKITQDTVSDFLNIIGQENAALIQKRIDKNYSQDYMSKNLDEYFTIFSDLIANEEVKFNDTVFTKIQDFVRRFFDKLGFADVDFTSGRGAYNFLKDYNKSIHKGTLSKGVTKATKGDVTLDEAKFSRVYQEVEAMKADLVNPDTKQGTAFMAADTLSNEVDRRLPRIEGITAEERADIVRNFVLDDNRGLVGLLNNYNQDRNDSVMGYLNSSTPGGKLLDARLQEFYKDDPRFGQIFQTTTDEAVATKVERETAIEEQATTPTEAGRKTKGQVVAEKLNIADEVTTEVTEANIDATKLTNFKSVPNAAINTVGELLGISPAKIKSKANLTAAEVSNAQRWFKANRQLVLDSLPDGFDVEGEATGVPRTILNALYNKRETRAKTKAGLKGQVKRTNILDSEFLELVDIIDGKPTRNRNTSARIIALADLLGKVITNQELRKTDPSLARIRSGMSEALFSKSDQNIADKYNQGKTYYEINNIDNVNRYINEDVPRIIQVFKDYPGLLTGNELVNGLNAIRNPELKKALRDGVKKYDELKVRGKFPKRDFAKFVGNTVEQMNTAKINEFNRQAEINFDAHWKAIDKALYADPTLIGPILIYLSNAVNSKTHIHRSGAKYTAYDKTAKGKLYLEHALQNVNAYRTLIEASINDKSKNRSGFKKAMKALKRNYNLIGVSKKDNSKLDAGFYLDENGKKVSFKNGMGLNWNIYDNSWVERYFNEYIYKQGGINPKNFVVVGEKTTLADKFGINSEGKSIALKDNASRTVKFSKAITNARSISSETKSRGMSTFDFDETLIIDGKNFVTATKGDDVVKIPSDKWPIDGPTYAQEGYTFDFSDFANVRGGKQGPLLQKMKNQIRKYGPSNVFVLTARMQEAAGPIHKWLQSQGINIPLENITGLGRSEGDAKAQWFVEKYAEGYNDMYFVDDALPNVKAVKHVFDQLDIKGKSVQAKIQFSNSIDDRFNSILEEVKNIDADKRFSESKARKRGKGEGKFRYFIPPSHEDFVGLLYNFMGSGKKGNQHRDFFDKSLVAPLNRAYRELNSAKQAISNDYKALLKQYPGMRKKLTSKTPDGDYLISDAVRVYLWNKFDLDIPGMTKTDRTDLAKVVLKDKDLLTFAESLAVISRVDEGYVKPGENWEIGDITTDLQDATGRIGRGKFFQEFIDNADIIFSSENMNKIEAAYGTNFREALEDVLYRTKNGTNRPTGKNRLVNRFLDYINGSVSATMFFNSRSAVLQQLSMVNFLNYGDNNIFKAAIAFGNQKQFWADYVTIFNSDMLKQRRAGRAFDLNANEIATQVSKSKEPIRALIKYLLNLGFTPTQLADSNAIALGGSTFYRNRIKTYLSQGLSEQDARAKAFDDFQEIAEATQQSARPDMLSQQQASPLGRIILAFQNTPSQYARLIKKSGLDLINRRKAPGYTTQWQSDMSNISRILYYTAVQNAIFYTLQTGLFAMMFSDDPQDEEFFDKKKDRILNGTIDSILRGSGVGGAIVSTIKNAAIKMHEQNKKDSWKKEDNALMMELLQLSPPIGIKARKLQQAEKELKYNAKEIEETSLLDISNPIYTAGALAIEATTNLPTARAQTKTENVKNAMNNEFAWWQRVFMGAGWSKWNLGATEKELEIEKKRSRNSSKGRGRGTRSRSRSR